MSPSTRVHIGQIKAAEQWISFFTVENYPSAVAGPGMPGFALVRADLHLSVSIIPGFPCGFQVGNVNVAV